MMPVRVQIRPQINYVKIMRIYPVWKMSLLFIDWPITVNTKEKMTVRLNINPNLNQVTKPFVTFVS